MEIFEKLMTFIAIAAGAGAWFYMKRKQGKGLLDSAKSAAQATDTDKPGQ